MSAGGPPLDAPLAEAVATAFVRALARGAWADAVAVASLPDLAVPPDAAPDQFLRDLWAGLVAQHGPLVAGRVAATAPHGLGRTVDLAVRLGTASVVLRVVVGLGARVTGFWITPPQRRHPAPGDGTPPVVDAE